MKKQCVWMNESAASTTTVGRTIEEAVREMWNREKEKEHAHLAHKPRFVFFYCFYPLSLSSYIHTHTYSFTNILSLSSQCKTTELTGLAPHTYTYDKRLDLCQYRTRISISLKSLDCILIRVTILMIHNGQKKKEGGVW